MTAPAPRCRRSPASPSRHSARVAPLYSTISSAAGISPCAPRCTKWSLGAYSVTSSARSSAIRSNSSTAVGPVSRIPLDGLQRRRARVVVDDAQGGVRRALHESDGDLGGERERPFGARQQGGQVAPSVPGAARPTVHLGRGHHALQTVAAGTAPPARRVVADGVLVDRQQRADPPVDLALGPGQARLGVPRLRRERSKLDGCPVRQQRLRGLGPVDGSSRTGWSASRSRSCPASLPMWRGWSLPGPARRSGHVLPPPGSGHRGRRRAGRSPSAPRGRSR